VKQSLLPLHTLREISQSPSFRSLITAALLSLPACAGTQVDAKAESPAPITPISVAPDTEPTEELAPETPACVPSGKVVLHPENSTITVEIDCIADVTEDILRLWREEEIVHADINGDYPIPTLENVYIFMSDGLPVLSYNHNGFCQYTLNKLENEENGFTFEPMVNKLIDLS